MRLIRLAGPELCVLDHGDGPGACWIRSLAKADEVMLRKPEGTFVAAKSAPYHVFAGEETATVAFGAMLGALPAGARVYGLSKSPVRTIAYLAGEAGRPALARLSAPAWSGSAGWPRRSVLVKPFWAPGKHGLE